MKTVAGLALALCVVLAAPIAYGADAKINLVAAENFYADIARQIGGNRVAVSSIMNNPGQDPHLFETTPAVARLVVFNGADYDPWIEKLLNASPRADRREIIAAELMRKKAGDNPHLWYDPATMPTLAKAIAATLSAIDPDHETEYSARQNKFLASLAPLTAKIAAIRGKFVGTAVTASEPVFGLMANALGLSMRNERFQLSIMNGTEPSVRDVAAFERDLKEHRVRVMFYNRQASDKAAQRLVDVARAAKVPVVAVSEIQPPGVSYQDWMLGQLSDTEKALAGPNS
jgi:zinc/manganese transport system substrate-binding protein